jgi:uncharacterized protein (DUF1778 family)
MKTITMRVDDSIYEILKKAADGERRTISNFLENASLQYLSGEMYVTDAEMNSIVSDKELTEGLYKGLDDAKKV